MYSAGKRPARVCKGKAEIEVEKKKGKLLGAVYWLLVEKELRLGEDETARPTGRPQSFGRGRL